MQYQLQELEKNKIYNVDVYLALDTISLHIESKNWMSLNTKHA